MFLQSYLTFNDPLMAETASRSFINSIPGFPLLQEHQNFPSNLSPWLIQGVCPVVEDAAKDTISSGGFPVTKKRGREEFRPYIDREISVKVHSQCLELDQFVGLHTETVRAELEEKRRRCWRQVAGAVEVGVQRMLRGKDLEIESMNRRNSFLEERARALLVEGQLWRSLAQANEATVVSLRRDLELLLLSTAASTSNVAPSLEEGQGDNGDLRCDLAATITCTASRVDDEGEAPLSSCCHRGGEQRQRQRQQGNARRGGWCKGCGWKEVSVLLLPCRHLCLCSDCESGSEACPLCFCPKTATVQVYMT